MEKGNLMREMKVGTRCCSWPRVVECGQKRKEDLNVEHLGVTSCRGTQGKNAQKSRQQLLCYRAPFLGKLKVKSSLVKSHHQ